MLFTQLVISVAVPFNFINVSTHDRIDCMTFFVALFIFSQCKDKFLIVCVRRPMDDWKFAWHPEIIELWITKNQRLSGAMNKLYCTYISCASN